MKYIKYFESESYSEVNIDELKDMISRDSLTGREIYHIVDCISDTPFLYKKGNNCATIIIPTLTYINKKTTKIISKEENVENIKKYSNKYREVYSIHKHDDEWFILIDHTCFKYYKCDQIDGLIDCLKNKLLSWE